MTRILIIGAGIAGSASALALHKAGFEVAVYEAHPETGSGQGAFLTLASNGMRALAQFDAAAVVRRLGFPLTAMQVLDDTGAVVADVPLGEHDNPATNYRCLLRADLAAALQAEALRRGIPIRYGSNLVGLNQGTYGATVDFEDGHRADGDLVLGADGLNSTLRQLTIPGPIGPNYAGQQVFYGYTKDATPPTAPERITMVRSSVAAFGYTVSPTGETYWFARVSGEAASFRELEEGTAAGWRERLVPLLRQAATPAADIVAATGDQLMLTNACDMPIGMPWREVRALLLGDAAHAASPATGQGASMALEDAVVLAKALRDAPDQETALAGYERVRRPRVEHNIVVSGQLSAGKPPSGPGPARGSDEDLVRVLDWDTPFEF